MCLRILGHINRGVYSGLRGGERNEKIRNREEKSKEKRGETKMRKDRKKGKKGEKRNCKFLSTY